MASVGIASRVTHFSSVTSSAAQEVASGASIIVHAIVVSAAANAVISVRKADGTQIMVVRVIASTTFTLNVPFIADGGLEFIATSGTAEVSVVHSQPGR